MNTANDFYYDQNAPWWGGELDVRDCPECHGTGYHFTAYNYVKEFYVPCTKQTYDLLPDSEWEASDREHYIKGDAERCTCCEGEGILKY